MNAISEKDFKDIWNKVAKDSHLCGSMSIEEWDAMCDAMREAAKNHGWSYVKGDNLGDYPISEADEPECFAFMEGAKVGFKLFADSHRQYFGSDNEEKEALIDRINKLESENKKLTQKIMEAQRILKR